MDSLSPMQKGSLVVGAGILAFFGISYVFNQIKNDPVEVQDNSIVPERKSSQQNNKIAGLYNFGNTCFLNSVIQALSSLKQFQLNLEQFVKSRQNRKKSDTYNFQLLEELLACIKSINSNSTDSPISISKVLDVLVNLSSELCNSQQQDSHEFFLVVVSALDQIYSKQGQLSLSSRITKSDSLDNVLMGFTQSCIECQACKTKRSIKLETFYNLSLQINSQRINSLEDALRRFQMDQYLQNVNCQFCSIKKFVTLKQELVEKIKKASFMNAQEKEKLLQALKKLINYCEKLKIVDEQIDQINLKMNNFVDGMHKQLLPLFDKIKDKKQNLDLIVQFMAEFKQIKSLAVRKTKICKLPKILVVHFKRLVMDQYTGNFKLMTKYVQFPETLKFENKKQPKQYKLTSLIAYVGSGFSGHYYAFRKKHKDASQWFYVSDKYVREVDWNQTRNQIGYMLFYQS